MKAYSRITSIALVAALSFAFAACRAKPSMASKSAAAYADAQKKGIPVSGGEHGGHAAAEVTASTGHEGMQMDHATMTGEDRSAMAGMQHGAMKMPGMEHSTGQMAGMQHGAMAGMSGMQHGASANVTVVTEAPRSSAAIANVQPSATLRSDEFDAPAAISQSEAAKTTGDPMTHKKDHE